MAAFRKKLLAAGSATAMMLAVASPAAAETIVQPAQLNTQTAAGSGDTTQASEQSIGDITISGGDGQNLVAPSQVNTQQATGEDIAQGSSQEIGDVEID